MSAWWTVEKNQIAFVVGLSQRTLKKKIKQVDEVDISALFKNLWMVWWKYSRLSKTLIHLTHLTNLKYVDLVWNLCTLNLIFFKVGDYLVFKEVE